MLPRARASARAVLFLVAVMAIAVAGQAGHRWC
jgi:hypothetical protein